MSATRPRCDERARAGRVDVHPQPLPGRDPAGACRRSAGPTAAARAPGPGRALAVAVDEAAEAGERLLAGDLLLDDRRHQRLHDPVGARRSGRGGGGARPRRRAGGGRLGSPSVVVGAEQRRARVERPVGAGAPGLGVHLAVAARGRRPAAWPGPSAYGCRARRRRRASRNVGSPAPRRWGPSRPSTETGRVGPPHPLRRRHATTLTGADDVGVGGLGGVSRLHHVTVSDSGRVRREKQLNVSRRRCARAARPAVRPENRQPPRKVPSSAL